MVKVLFVYPNLTGQEIISMGISSISAYAKEKGHETFLMDYTWGGSVNDCIEKIKQIQPQIIAFSVNSGDYNFCLNLAKNIKQNFNIPILFGGIQPTVEPEKVIKQEPVDIVCINEGEQALVELLDKLEKRKDFTDVKNLWVKKEGKITRNSLRPLIKDLDTLPFLDRKIYDYLHYLKANSGKIDMITSRGCPFSCSYCINSFNKKMFKGKYFRLRSPKKVIEEIKLLKKEYDIKSVSFLDDVFTFDKVWLKEFCESYAQEVKLPFTCLARAETINDKVCSWLKKAGCILLQMGVESGNEEFRKKVLKRYTTNEQIVTAFKCAKKYNLKTYSYNVVGFPFETEKEYWDTIKLNRVLKPDYMQANVFMPYPGTELHKLCINKGFLKEDTVILKNQNCFSILNYPDTSKNEIHRRRKYFRFRVFRAYDLKKALTILFIDLFFSFYCDMRPNLPLPIKKIIRKIKRQLRS